MDHGAHVGKRVFAMIASGTTKIPSGNQGLALAARPAARLGRRSLRGLKDCPQSGTQGVDGSIIARRIIHEMNHYNVSGITRSSRSIVRYLCGKTNAINLGF